MRYMEFKLVALVYCAATIHNSILVLCDNLAVNCSVKYYTQKYLHNDLDERRMKTLQLVNIFKN